MKSLAITGDPPEPLDVIASYHRRPGPVRWQVPNEIRNAVAERKVGDTPPGTDPAGVTRQLDGAGGQITLTNTETSSYGASISSFGYCGGPQTGFTVNSYGFEWTRISVWSAGTYLAGDWTRVPQDNSVRFPLPISAPGVVYIVDGWDETPWGGDQRTVITSFLRVPDLTYSTWLC